MTTVREMLVETYGDAYDGESYRLANGHGMSHVFSIWQDQLVLNHTTGWDVHGYADTIGIANNRTLSEQWAHLDGLTSGPYSGQDSIGLELDDEAPEDLIEVIDFLSDYPILDDEEHSRAEMEMIDEHWESYGRSDALDALATAIGGDPDLSDYATEVLDFLTFSGVVDTNWTGGYPSIIDVSAVEFNTAEIVAWIMRRWSVTVTLGNAYGPETVLRLTRKAILY